MKRLYLLRHAKSSWGEPDLADFDRPLNHRGRKAAPFMGRHIAERQLIPDTIISSPAQRARETAALVKENWEAVSEIQFNDRVYEASPQALMQIAEALPDKFSSALIIGHNPGLEGFLKILTGRSESMPTAALAVIELAIQNWMSIRAGSGTLVEVGRPRDLMKEETEI